MSRVYDALQQMEKDMGRADTVGAPHFAERAAEPAGLAPALSAALSLNVQPNARLVALTEPRSLGAEKFRALVTRLDHVSHQKELRSLQVTSSVVNEGKSLVAANLAITFAKYTRSRVLLIEGDMHRPGLCSLFGFSDVKGIRDWWSAESNDVSNFLIRLGEMRLWLLSAGGTESESSHILQSARFAELFDRLLGWFDWIIVDSTPMLPVADVNLWSRMVDGSLLVVREGVASAKALHKGLASLDNAKLIGTVMNGVSESDRTGYAGAYYGVNRQVGGKASD